jgi:molybdenum cofactor cytidylyltransferase
MGIVLDCVVPAAGASSRMGAWKPLLPWGQGRIIDAVLACIEAAGLRPIVVAGFRGEELRRHLEARPGLLVVDNPRWEAGMLGSVLRGALETRGEAFFVAPADMPGIPTGVFASLLAARFDGGDETLFPACRGEAGHPVLIPRSLIPEMSRLDPGSKLRDFLRRGSWRLVETGEAAVLADLDTREDYERGLRGLTPSDQRGETAASESGAKWSDR